MNVIRYFILLVVLQIGSFNSGAQDTNYLYQDTAILTTDSVEVKAIEQPATGEVNANKLEKMIADTSLQINGLAIKTDSIASLKDMKSFAYAKILDSLLLAKKRSMEKEQAALENNTDWLNRFFSSPITKYFFWILAGVFVSFILYKLFFADGIFQQQFAGAKVKLLEEEKESLSKTTDYGKLINQAVSNRNFRMAVRYHYLQSLQKLTSKGAIQFALDKTNYQYEKELSGKAYQKSFAALTHHYEYVWYGEFEIDENNFTAIQYLFNQFNSGI